MNFLRKILLITIIAVLTGNTEGAQTARTVFDLPEDTPGLRIGNTQNKTINNIPDQECIHVIVPRTPAVCAVGVAQAMNMEGNIYFPADGTQPTTEEAVKYSCANIDNREDSPITDWYMMMFGVIPVNQAAIGAAIAVGNPDNNVPLTPNYVQAGWRTDYLNMNAYPQRIISFDASVDGTQVDDLSISGQQIGKRDLFIREFRKIASTSVGRVLLYRILIEIRRHNLGGNVGVFEVEDVYRIFIQDRNQLRSILIQYGNNIQFSYDGILEISNNLVNSSVIGTSIDNNGYTNIVFGFQSGLDINLFHELGHWYHLLRKYARSRSEMDINLLQHSIGKYLWNNLDGSESDNRVDCSTWYWRGERGANFEEIRNIIGSSRDIDENYLEGDDLSENLYRLCSGAPLRFGHRDNSVPNDDTDDNFFEDTVVIHKIELLTLNNLSKYTWNWRSNITVDCEKRNYQSSRNNGLGKFRMCPQRPAYHSQSGPSSTASTYCPIL